MQKTKNKSFFAAVICLVLCVALLTGATFAWFSDSVSNTGNKIQAGTLDVALGQYDGKEWKDISSSDKPVFDSGDGTDNLWEPGYSQYAILEVANKGNLALKYRIDIVDYSGVSDQELYNVIEVYAKTPASKEEAAQTAAQVSQNLADGKLNYIGTLAELIDDEDGAAYGTLETKDQAVYATVVLKMKESAGNEYKGKSAEFDIIVKAAQQTYEKDGFDTNQYDVSAGFLVNVTGVKLNEHSLKIGPGDSKQLTATVIPGSAGNTDVTWSSSDERVATVGENGMVSVQETADKDETATITVTTKDGGYYDTCEVTVGGGTCLSAGTAITMADGSKKNIEDITENDYVLTFNHETGCTEPQRVGYVYKGACTDSSFTLHFAYGNSLTIVGLHDLFEKESGKYVTIAEYNAESFTGKHFYNAEDSSFVRLDDVTYNDEETEYYSLYTEYNYNCIANGMLSVADDVDYMLNIYDFDENLKADADTLAADIEKYGLHAYDESIFYTKHEYDVLRACYLNIVFGKGLSTIEQVMGYRMEYINR